MAVNGQYSDPPFGMSGAVAQTGAPGTAVPGPETSAGPVVGTPAVVAPYASSQAPIPRVEVTSGDTCSMSADAPVPAGGDPLTGLSLADVTQTGAGQGSGHMPHPNSMARQ